MGTIRQQNRDTSTGFMGNMRTRPGTYTNSSGSTVELPIYMVMGRATVSGKWKPWRDDATDGSEIPRGVLLTTYSVPAGGDQDIAVVHAGDVVRGKLVFDQEGKSLDTVITRNWDSAASPPVATPITYGRVEDVLMANTQIILIGSTDLTGYDNTIS